MGSFRADLKIGGKTLNCRYSKVSFSRDVTQRGKVATGIKGGLIEVRVDSDDTSMLAEMTVNSLHKPFDFEISYYKAEGESEMKKLTAVHCYAVNYEEVLDTENREQMNIFMRFACEEITLGDAYHHSMWVNNG